MQVLKFLFVSVVAIVAGVEAGGSKLHTSAKLMGF